MNGDINYKSNFRLCAYFVNKDDDVCTIYILHYINVDQVSWITLQKLLQNAMELLQIATA